MKLLLDQNISFRILDLIKTAYPEARQVRQLGLENATDAEIRNYAKANGFTIVTFDADFYDLALLKGVPPKIIWLKTGNTSTKKIAEILVNNMEIIQSFITDKSYTEIACLEIKT